MQMVQFPDAGRLSERQALDELVSNQVTENRLRARRLLLSSELHRRAQDERDRHRDQERRFALTALEETTAEVAPLLGVSDQTVEIQISQCDRLREALPSLWDMCLAGRLDLGKAGIVLEAAERLANEDDVPRFAALMDEYFARHDDPSQPLVTLTRGQIHAAARYRRLRFAQQSPDQRFAAAFRKRRAFLRLDDNGMGHLGVHHLATEAMAADYRLTLIAKKLCQGDETRTLEQMRADVMIDLILGRITIPASTSDLEEAVEDDDPDGETLVQQHRVGAFARPVIVVTVPIQSLMGVTDEPGVLAGHNAVPAEMARLLAQDPESTWYRMLTDERRGGVELSVNSYHPTGPVWRQTVARHQTCLYPGCCRPATTVHLDHRVPYPRGRTSTENLGPLCPRHHKVKHSRGFTLTKDADGSYTLTTRAGSVFHSRPPEQPTSDWPEETTGGATTKETTEAA